MDGSLATTPFQLPPQARVILVQNRETDSGDRLRAQVEHILTSHALEWETVVVTARGLPLKKPMGPLPHLLIVLGGDGTFLNTIRCYAQEDIPLVGINTGSLGFLTRIESNGVADYITRILEGEAFVERRMMLAVNDETQIALNDVVIKHANPSQLSKFQVYIDDEHLATYDADGVIVATPTGSTAYNLSAGGPIIDPQAQVIVMTLICPHSLSAKPIVIPAHRVLRITCDTRNTSPLVCAMDGLEALTLKAGEAIQVFQSAHRLPLLSFTGESNTFYAVLKRKLGWGANPRPQNKKRL